MSLEAPTYAGLMALSKHFKLIHGDAEALMVLQGEDLTPESFANWYALAGSPAKFEQLMRSVNAPALVFAQKKQH